MYCQYCGRPLEPCALTCSCGAYLKRETAPGWNLFAVLGFVFTFMPFIPLAGIVFCIAGLSQIKQSGQRGRWLAIWGIVLSIVFTLIAAAAAAVFFTYTWDHFPDSPPEVFTNPSFSIT